MKQQTGQTKGQKVSQPSQPTEVVTGDKSQKVTQAQPTEQAPATPNVAQRESVIKSAGKSRKASAPKAVKKAAPVKEKQKAKKAKATPSSKTKEKVKATFKAQEKARTAKTSKNKVKGNKVSKKPTVVVGQRGRRKVSLSSSGKQAIREFGLIMDKLDMITIGEHFNRLQDMGIKARHIEEQLTKNGRPRITAGHLFNCKTLANAPATIRKMVQSGAIAGTFVLNEIRKHPNNPKRALDIITKTAKKKKGQKVSQGRPMRTNTTEGMFPRTASERKNLANGLGSLLEKNYGIKIPKSKLVRSVDAIEKALA